MPTALAGIRILDLTTDIGVYGTRLLADLGAEVIRPEAPGGDPQRHHAPFLHGRGGPERSLFFAFMNAGKKSVTLDLASTDGRALLERLAPTCDVIFFGGQAAELDSLGLENIRRSHPRLVLTALTPFGITGPLRSWKGYDLVAWAAGGIVFATGDPDRRPLAPAALGQLSLILGGYHAALGTLAAIRVQRRDGAGQVVDVSLQDTALAATGEMGVAAFLDDLLPKTRSGSRRPFAGPLGHFKTTDGAAAVLALTPDHWAALAQWIYEVTGNESALDPVFTGPASSRMGDNREIVNLFTEDLAINFTKQEMFEEGQRRGVSITPVNDLASVLEDPQLAYRNFWVDMVIDGETVRVPGPPGVLSATPYRAGAVPTIGEHTSEILGGLGIEPGEIAALEAIGVV